jgi:hypothetical protein
MLLAAAASVVDDSIVVLQGLDKREESRRAPEREERNGTGERTRRGFDAPESTRFGCCPAELRRRIWAAWRRYSAREQRGNGEEREGIYRVDSLLDLLPGNGRNQLELRRQFRARLTARG